MSYINDTDIGIMVGISGRGPLAREGTQKEEREKEGEEGGGRGKGSRLLALFPILDLSLHVQVVLAWLAELMV